MYRIGSPRLISRFLPLVALSLPALAQDSSSASAAIAVGGMPEAGAPAVLSVEDELEGPKVVQGEKLDPASAYGPGYVESMEVVMERERLNPSPTTNFKVRNGAQGSWAVPSRRSSFHAHSGEHYIINRWGDTRMSIEFGESVDFEGSWISGHAAPTLWADGVRYHGYRGDELVASGEWLDELSDQGVWVPAGFAGVTRIEIEARAVYQGSGWFGLDDLTYTRANEDPSQSPVRVVVDFDDLPFNTKLKGSGYAGLTWPAGTGDFAFETPATEVHEPVTPPGGPVDDLGSSGTSGQEFLGGGGTAPNLTQSFSGPKLGDSGAGWLPPDTSGSIGPNHFVAVVNQNLSVYDRVTGNRVINTGLRNFFGTNGHAGDPRAVYDPHSNRFIIIACDFSTLLWVAVSLTDDPTGSWFKTSVVLSLGTDSNKWPDYPTLGVDATGIYSASYMVGGGMSLFAIDKAPLIAGSPSLGTVTAFRNLPWEGAIQPCVTYGTPGRMYCVSRRSNTTLRLRYVQGSMSNPTMVEAGNVSVQSHGSPPDAPALGSVSPLDALDYRPMNAVFRNGSVYMAHGVGTGGRSSCRWYEIDPIGVQTVQEGTVNDPVMSYMMPSISVNADDSVVVAFSGSNPNQFAASYFAGRVASDPLGQLSTPVLLKAGTASYNTVGASGVNRWGDYSLTSVDPLDDTTIWTIQEHTRSQDVWGTRIGKLEFPYVCPTPTTYCMTSPNSVGSGAIIDAFGVASISSNNFELDALGLPANKPGLFFYGPNQTVAVLGDGLLCVSGQITRLSVQTTDAFGFAAAFPDFSSPPFTSGPGQVSAGDVRYFQFWYRDPSFGSSGFNLTNGLEVTFCP